jgi:hypothetical protein
MPPAIIKSEQLGQPSQGIPIPIHHGAIGQLVFFTVPGWGRIQAELCEETGIVIDGGGIDGKRQSDQALLGLADSNLLVS